MLLCHCEQSERIFFVPRNDYITAFIAFVLSNSNFYEVEKYGKEIKKRI